MGSFEDFLKSVDTDAIGDLIDKQLKPQIIMSQFNPEDMPAAMESIYNRAISDAVKISLVYLREYHSWLQTQL